MSNAESRLALLEKDFQEKLSVDLVEIDFKESGAPLYVRTSYSSFRKAPVFKAIAENDLSKMNALMLVQFGLNEDGSYAFKNGHVDALMKKVDSKVLERVANDITSAIKFEDEGTFEVKQAEKNSEKGATFTQDLLSRNTLEDQ